MYVISDDCVHARSTRQSTFQTKKLSLPKRKCSNFEIEGLLAHFDPDAARLLEMERSWRGVHAVAQAHTAGVYAPLGDAWKVEDFKGAMAAKQTR